MPILNNWKYEEKLQERSDAPEAKIKKKFIEMHGELYSRKQ